MSHHKFRSPESNTTDPRFWEQWQAHRAAIRPPECCYASPCWVTRPYDAIGPNNHRPRCTSCGGLIAPTGRERLKGFWPEPAAAILESLERGEA